MITKGQMKMMGAFKTMVGGDAIHQVLIEVTKGRHISFADQDLSVSQMSYCILELKLRFPKAWQTILRKKFQKKKAQNTTSEISPDKNRAIWKLRHILKIGDNEEYYHGVCQRSIKKDTPETESEALTVIGALNRIVRQEKRK